MSFPKGMLSFQTIDFQVRTLVSGLESMSHFPTPIPSHRPSVQCHKFDSSKAWSRRKKQHTEAEHHGLKNN